MKLKIYTDGGARNNPGPAAIGVVIKNEKNQILKKISKYLGVTTNNQAEYYAVIGALKVALGFKAEVINIYLDSQLVVEQLNRKFRIKDKDLAPLFVQVWNLTLKFKKITFNYIPREQNKEADLLVNQCLNKIQKYYSFVNI